MSQDLNQKPSKAKKTALTRIITTRLNDADFAQFEAKVEASNMSRSDFFRDCILSNKTKVVAREVESKDYQKLLFVINKASNNLNQIAKKLNTASKLEVMTQQTYDDALYNLSLISSYLKGVL